MRLIFCGSGEFGLPSLRALHAAGHELVQIFTQPDRPAGRGRKLTPTPIGQAADAMGLPAIRTANINGEVLQRADSMVVIAFGQKIGQEVVSAPRLGSINLHASRLPKYRGAAPINWAILQGETITGNSIIRLASRMDAGAVLGISEVPIGETETAGELHDRLSEDGASLVLRVVRELDEGRAVETTQDEALATVAPKLSRESANLDFQASAQVLCRRVRGLYPWPGCRVQLIELSGAVAARLRLVRALPIAGENSTPGMITATGAVQTGDGAMRVIEVQPDGKGPMSLETYRRGNAWEPGMRLESVTSAGT